MLPLATRLSSQNTHTLALILVAAIPEVVLFIIILVFVFVFHYSFTILNYSLTSIFIVNGSFESTFMEEIIKDIFNKLNLAYFRVATYPVGIEFQLQGLNSLLSRDSGDVCMVGILGIGGMGKTTMAKAIYNLLHSEFEESCFLGEEKLLSNHMV